MPNRRNKKGIKVKRCCASCKYKEILGNGERICTVGCESHETCRHWRMRDELRNAGNPFGTIKTKEYLHYVLDIRYREKVENFSHRTEQRDIEEIRKEYLMEHKDIRTCF